MFSQKTKKKQSVSKDSKKKERGSISPFKKLYNYKSRKNNHSLNLKDINMTGVLNSDNIDIRMQGVEISTFTTFEGLNKCFNLNLNENNIFYYSIKEDN